MRALQGMVPVLYVSLARVKQSNFADMFKRIERLLMAVVREHAYLRAWGGLTDEDRTA